MGIISHGSLFWKWRNDRRSEHNFCNCVKKPEKNAGLQRGLNPWLRDTGAMLYQLSYEATDVGSRSNMGSYVPVKEMSVYDIWNKSYMNCGNEMKMKKWSSKWTQFMQLRKEAWSLFCSTEITSVMSTRVNEWMNNKSNANPAPEKSLPYSMLRTIIGPAGRPVYSANRKQYHVVYVKELNNRLQNIFQFDWVSLSIQQVSRTSWLDLLRATT